MRLGNALRRRIQLARLPGPRFDPGAAPVSELPLPPVFIGGTGRSGTTVTGRLLGAHPDLLMISQEVKFVTLPGGLCDLVRGRTTLREFKDRVVDLWFVRRGDRGLHVLMDRETVDAALAELQAGFRADPWRASAAFTHRLLDPLAVAAGASGWVETTPLNAHKGPTLRRMFPGMRLIHSVRDGRDVACSVATKAWGPADVDEALDWWAHRLERAFVVTSRMPPDSYLVIQLEELVVREREREYARLLAYLGMRDDPAMHAYFDERMAPARAHAGRWRQDVPAERLGAFEAHYEALAATFAARNWPYDPEGSAKEPSAVS